MMSHVRIKIRIFRRTEQREIQHAILDLVPVFAVVEKRGAVMCVRKVRIALACGLELCNIPAGVVVRGAAECSILDVESRLCRMNFHGKRDPEKPVRLVPLDLCHEVQTLGIVRENDSLAKP